MRRQEGETPCRRPGRIWKIRHPPARGVAQAAPAMLPMGRKPPKGYRVARRSLYSGRRHCGGPFRGTLYGEAKPRRG
jgi:hypothetical protein